MKILKRNQIIISVLALMLITVGYMSFTSNSENALQTANLVDSEKMAGIGDAKLVNSNDIEEESSISSEENDNSSDANAIVDNKESDSVKNTESSETSTSTGVTTVNSNNYSNVENGDSKNYFVASRLERDKMYSQMLESYQKLAEDTAVPAEQKNISTQEISNINNRKNAIMIAENLIKNLGFEDVVIFVNNNSTSVIVKSENLSEADVAQIQNIVCREVGVEVGSIHISLK